MKNGSVGVAIVGLGWWGKKLASSLAGSSVLHLVRGIEPNPAAVLDLLIAADSQSTRTSRRLSSAPTSPR